MKRDQRYAPFHPGEILDEEFLQEMKLSQYRLAQALGVPRRRINEIVLGQRSITPDTALRLARYFGTSPEFWLNLQATYDLEVRSGISSAPAIDFSPGILLPNTVVTLPAAVCTNRNSHKWPGLPFDAGSGMDETAAEKIQ